MFVAEHSWLSFGSWHFNGDVTMKMRPAPRGSPAQFVVTTNAGAANLA